MLGEIRVLNAKGDESITWDPKNKDEVEHAKKKFQELKESGYRFYEVQEARGKEVTKFPKKAGRLLAAPGARSAEDKRTGARPAAMAGGPVSESA